MRKLPWRLLQVLGGVTVIISGLALASVAFQPPVYACTGICSNAVMADPTLTLEGLFIVAGGLGLAVSAVLTLHQRTLTIVSLLPFSVGWGGCLGLWSQHWSDGTLLPLLSGYGSLGPDWWIPIWLGLAILGSLSALLGSLARDRAIQPQDYSAKWEPFPPMA